MSKPALTWNLHLPDMSVDRKKGAGLKKRKICSVLIDSVGGNDFDGMRSRTARRTVTKKGNRS